MVDPLRGYCRGQLYSFPEPRALYPDEGILMSKDIKKRVSALRKEIKRHNELYYTEGKPEISDARYDELMKELKALEKAHPDLFSPDSPTQTVGAPVPVKLAKVRHVSPMLSLDSVNSSEDAEHFGFTCEKEIGGSVEYACEPKLDGLSIELVYENGVFTRGSTRGDGVMGEDVTLNLKTIPSVPGKLRGKRVPRSLAVRGEVMMHISDFQELNKNETEKGGEAFANPRNAAAGSMRQLDPRITSERRLRVYCYQILEISGDKPDTQEGSLELLKELGFAVSPGARVVRSVKDVIAYHRAMEEKRDELDYEIDGVVVKLNSIAAQERMGMRTTSPKWAMAYKFKPRRETTRVDDIVVQVGRTGTLTPVALLHPVEVGGVTVSRATLHNMDQVEKLGVKIGDHVKVERAGDVIPYISEVLKEKRTGKEKDFGMPGKCPVCGTDIVKEDVFYRCPAGLSCPGQLKEAINHYASKDAVDIEGFSDKTVELLYEKGLIKSMADIYTLKSEELLELEGFKEKKTKNLLDAIEKAKHVTLDRFIFALGIRNVGKHIGAVLAEKFTSLEALKEAGEDELMEVKEIGPEIAACITSFFKEKRNILEIDKLIKNGVKIASKEKVTSGKFIGKKFVFTGTLKTLSRSQAQKIVEKEGGSAGSNVTTDTDFVVAGEDAGSKLAEAKKKGIKVLSEEEFRGLLS